MVRFSFKNDNFVSAVISKGKLIRKAKEQAMPFWQWKEYSAAGWKGPLVDQCTEFHEFGTGQADTYIQLLCIDRANSVAYFYEGR
jgi:hypothetical protein